MSVILFVVIVIAIGGILCLAGVIHAFRAASVSFDTPCTAWLGLGALCVAFLISLYVASTVKSVEKSRTPIEISYIDAYDANGLQEYEVTTVDGDVYKTNYTLLSGPFVYIEESKTDEFALYKAEYRREAHAFGLTLDDGESPAEYIILAVPSEYYKLHTVEHHDGTTRVFSSEDERMTLVN